jgi:hypothetical protein
MHYIEWMKQDAERISTQLRRRIGALDATAEFLLEDIGNFEKRYVSPMFGSRAPSSADLQEKIAAIKMLFADKNSVLENLSESIAKTSHGLKTILEEHAEILDDELLTTFDIDEEPRAKAAMSQGSSGIGG